MSKKNFKIWQQGNQQRQALCDEASECFSKISRIISKLRRLNAHGDLGTFIDALAEMKEIAENDRKYVEKVLTENKTPEALNALSFGGLYDK